MSAERWMVTAPDPDWRRVIHAYVRWERSRWRTCQLCGSGANARIHDVSRIARGEVAP